ncbi:MAG: aminotransferase class I/II-fold pyridoxal phosphate-dependent enzyme [Chloroflexi bacterium]|nr:aminotransferase class I/II-fold pyridoxal phosphate-dependent enzyme [Ardenticatenaceae bacterium]MBL1127109.1 aminotransferase class I/II-fold pyridoxal phosphate-dependent enzyme [Chloroflexota bacterium]NOG33170.1 aminotransferase class I/II-fold pyridoxal phosphate-dependent enzyme [Chloroflexota bacterium]GIK54964.1 MAG: L-methionine gamma-lyase [Chloroflexota bacterium]
MSEKGNMATRQIHAGDAANPSTAVSAPIYQSATFAFETPEEIAAAMAAQAHPQFYGRYATPNTKQVELTVAALEQGEAALAVASGMAAVSLVFFTFLKQGDHVVAQTTHYPSSTKVLEQKLAEYGVATTFVDQTNPAAFAAAIRPNTRLIYVETPANPVLRLTDLTAVAAIARAHHILTATDNTFATPYNQRPLTLGIDIVLHSATKYLAGHSDVVAGVVVGKAEHIAAMWHTHVMLGAVLHPMEAWLLERGLKTFDLRMERHNRNAQAVAEFLAGHTAVREVYYPGLPAHPQHDLARRQMPGGYSGMVCFDLKGGRTAGYELLQRLKLIKLAVSLGGVHSLITHAASTISAILQSDEAIAASGVQPGLVRFSVGLEDVNDLIADLAQALGD